MPLILSLALATVSDHDLFGSVAGQGTKALDLLEDIHPLNHLAEHHVLAIQPLGHGGGDEEPIVM